eukprot:TRINITY_DN2498_c0_g2_i1.p1 TRINITY_DN2498_c0_g2~~TRINITY_DN2498_c0_g2_i1.p1  ORF type:complete len:691 (+),score=166.34 TRINITY_DN2498_c0_g2_i1:106-2178(+)
MSKTKTPAKPAKPAPESNNLEGTLILSILRGNKLINLDVGDKSDPYVRFHAMVGQNKLAAFQTKTIDNSLDPIWNERFSVYCDNIPSVDFTFDVYDEDAFGQHEHMGCAQVTVTKDTKFDKDQTLKLLTKPEKKEKKTKKEKELGTITISISYRKGEQINLNKEAEKRQESKKNWMELPSETKNSMKEWRANKDVFTECEEAKMAILISIYKNNFGCDTPVFEVEKKAIAMYNYQKSKWPVGADDIHTAKWFGRMKDKDGDFINEAKDVIQSICSFQQSKKSAFRDGYVNDPEGLFCEELKVWASTELALMSIDTAKPLLQKRVGYLEECLLVTDLFDRPSSLAQETIQMVIIKVRRILKYRAIANIDKENAHQNATRDFAAVKRHLTGLIRSGVKLLEHAFYCEAPEGVVSNAVRLRQFLQNDDNLRQVLGDELKAEEDRMRGISSTSSDGIWQQLDLRGEGLHDTRPFLEEVTVQSKEALANPLLPHVFSGDSSGIEEWFRGNAYITMHYLRAHGLMLEAGRLFVVLDKAANAAKTGGTLLVYGLANAQLNATLDSTKAIMDELKNELNTVSKIAECCFEELVMKNKATKERSDWMKHFKEVFPGIREVNNSVKQIQKDVSKIKQVANSMTLLERFQEAAKENDDFLSEADQFSERMAKVTGKPYEKPKPRELTAEDNEALKSLISGK